MPDTLRGYGLIQNFKRFGCKAKEPAAPRLCRLLNLSPVQFKSIQTTLENLGQRYLDIRATVSEQQEAMSLIEDKIISRHPHLFAGQKDGKKLFFALRVVKQKHRRDRHSFLEREQRREYRAVKRLKNIQQPKKVIDSTLDKNSGSELQDNGNPDQEVSDKNETFGSELADNEYLEEESHEDSESSGSEYADSENEEVHKVPHSHSVLNRLRVASPTAPLTRAARAALNTSESAQVIPVNKVNRNTTSKRPSSTTTEPEKTTPIRSFCDVRQFLKACNPPMDHYFQRFIEFGCNSKDFLHGMSSWEPDKRLAILKKILTGPDGKSVVTEMELAVIENKLETYFD